METIRKPAVAGQFYDAGQTSLQQTIEECFLDERGPKTLPKISENNKDIKGIIVPHAGYIYSGAIAAHAYHTLSENGFADTFIILGPNHTGIGSGIAVMTQGTWETPLGNVSINTEIAPVTFQLRLAVSPIFISLGIILKELIERGITSSRTSSDDISLFSLHPQKPKMNKINTTTIVTCFLLIITQNNTY